MKCQAEYCIYNKGDRYTLENPQVDFAGMCAKCIFLSLDRGFLESEKERQLKELAGRGKRTGDKAG